MDKVPLNFGKRFAHTEKKVRDRCVDMLKRWLRKHSELDRVDYLKLWKGLLLGLWMCNKQHVQQELALSMALLIHDIPRLKQTVWMDAFWESMQESCDKLDAKQVNKYCLLLRIVCAEVFQVLRLGGWAQAEMRSFAVTIGRGYAKYSSTSSGLRLVLELNRIFWAELMPQLKHSPAPPVKAILELLEPMFTTAASSSLKSLVHSIHEQILVRTPVVFRDALLSKLRHMTTQNEMLANNQVALTETIKVLCAQTAEADSSVSGCAPTAVNPCEAAAAPTAAAATAEAERCQSPVVQGRRTRKRRVASKSPDIAATLEDPVQTPPRKKKRKTVVSPQDSKNAASGTGVEDADQDSPKSCLSASTTKVSGPPRRASALRMPKRMPNPSVAQSPHARAIRATKLGDAARHVAFDLEATQIVNFSSSQRVALQVRHVLRKPAASLPQAGTKQGRLVAGQSAATK